MLDLRLRQARFGANPRVEENKAGMTKFLITGNASAGFSSLNNDSSNFGATFSPIFLWELSDKLMFESKRRGRNLVSIELQEG